MFYIIWAIIFITKP